MINPYKMEVATLIRNNFESDDRAIKTIYLECENGKKMEYIPGQFCELSVFGKGEAPFGIASSPTEEGKVLEFTANRAGLVTKALHETEIGEEIGVRGPLGNGFPISKFTHHNLVIIGGCLQVKERRASLVFKGMLLEGCKKRNGACRKRKPGFCSLQGYKNIWVQGRTL